MPGHTLLTDTGAGLNLWRIMFRGEKRILKRSHAFLFHLYNILDATKIIKMESRSGIAWHQRGDGCRKEVGISALRGQLGSPYGRLDAVSHVHQY